MAKQQPPAAVRNAGPITEVLARVLAPYRERKGAILEIAAGSGYHAAHFAGAFPELTWQPSDPDAAARESISEYAATSGLANLRPPLALDVRAPWPAVNADAIVCINMIHISPWAATLALFENAARIIPNDGRLITYGPYAIDGDFLAESNVAFDASLKDRNPEWGIRDVREIEKVARTNGLMLAETVRMPANNLTLIFERPSAR
jgi:SAM-dependent methyltransferase